MKGETENRVKELLTEGLSNKEIADRLHIAMRTVSWHVESLFRKYGLHGAADNRRLIVLLVKEDLARRK